MSQQAELHRNNSPLPTWAVQAGYEFWDESEPAPVPDPELIFRDKDRREVVARWDRDVSLSELWETLEADAHRRGIRLW